MHRKRLTVGGQRSEERGQRTEDRADRRYFGLSEATICCCGGRRAACECTNVQPTRLPLQLRRERGHDSLEAWIAAERVPVGEQFQLAIAKSVWQSHCSFELLECQIFFANPRRDDREVLDESNAVDGILV